LVKDLYNLFSWGELSSGRYFTGSFYWHNQMAGFIIILIPLLLSLFLATRNLYFKFILLLVIFVSFLAIVLTYSRGGWISMLASLMLFFAFSFKKIKSHIKPLFIMLAVFMIVTFIILKPANVGKTGQSIKSELSSQTRSVSGNLRTTVWQNAFKILRDNPIFGVGPGAFGSSYYKYQSVPWLYAKYTHNHYLQYMAELGIIGFFLFASIILSALFRVFEERKRLGDETRYPLLLGVIAALFGSALHALIDVDWSRISLYSIFWILLAVLFANLTKKEKKIDVVGIRKLIYLFPLALLVVSILLSMGNRNYEKAEKNLKDNKILLAEINIKRAINLNPYDSTLYLLYGQIKEIQKKQNAAKEIYHKVASFSSYNSEPYYRLGNIEFINKNYKQAKKLFLKAIALAPFTHPRLYVGLSETHLKLGEIKQARRTLKTAVENAFPLNESFRGFEYLYEYTGFKKDLGQTYIRLITLDIMLGEKEEAKRLLSVVEKDLDPKNPTIPMLKTFVIE
jgi:tetratricopeptide (TPR) repeat protein